MDYDGDAELWELRGKKAQANGLTIELAYSRPPAQTQPATPEDRRDGERSGGEFDQKDVEAMRGISPVTAWLHQVVGGDGEPDQALSFAPDNFPLQGVVGYRSLSHKPLYLHPAVMSEPTDVALNVNHIDCHKAADAFWAYWQANGETHKHGYYESTWGAINAALRTVGVVPHEWDDAAIDAAREGWEGRPSAAVSLGLFSDADLVKELARRNRLSEAQRKPIDQCDMCAHFVMWNKTGSMPEKYNPCAMRHEMKLREPVSPNDTDWGFYRPGCEDRSTQAPPTRGQADE